MENTLNEFGVVMFSSIKSGYGKFAGSFTGLTLFGVAMISMSGCSSEDPMGTPIPTTALQSLALQPTTNNTLTGRIMINQQIPMPMGYLVAYRPELPQDAAASAALRPDGTFKMENAPFGQVVLLLKLRLDQERKLRSADEIPSSANPVSGGNATNRQPVIVPGMRLPPPIPQAKLQPGLQPPAPRLAPKKEALAKLKLEVVEAGISPEAEWLINRTAEKYGSTKNPRLKKVIEAGENEYFVSLLVP